MVSFRGAFPDGSFPGLLPVHPQMLYGIVGGPLMYFVMKVSLSRGGEELWSSPLTMNTLHHTVIMFMIPQSIVSHNYSFIEYYSSWQRT